MQYTVSIDVPSIDKGLAFYCEAFGFAESQRPVEGYVILKCGDAQIGLVEKPAVQSMRKAATTYVTMRAIGPPFM